MSDIRALHRAADQELADDGGIAPLPENARSAHRHGKAWGGVEPLTERDPRAVRWVAVGLVVFWIAVVFTVRACSRADDSLGAVAATRTLEDA